MEDFLSQILQSIGGMTAELLVALVILVVGWIAALIVRGLARAGLRRINLDKRILSATDGKDMAKEVSVEHWISQVIYYIVLLLVMVAFFDSLQLLPAVTEALDAVLHGILAYLPQLLAAAFVALVAWIVASLGCLVRRSLLRLSKFDERLSSQTGLKTKEQVLVSDTLANVVYWFIWLLFLPAVLEALGLLSSLVPVQGLVNELLGALPNIVATALILFVGWVAARMIRQIVDNLLAGIGLDHWAESSGMETALGELKLSGVIARSFLC